MKNPPAVTGGSPCAGPLRQSKAYPGNGRARGYDLPLWAEQECDKGFTRLPNRLRRDLLKLPTGATRDALRTLWELAFGVSNPATREYVWQDGADVRIRLSANALADEAGIRPRAAYKAAVELDELGFVSRDAKNGSRALYTLSQHHRAALASYRAPPRQKRRSKSPAGRSERGDDLDFPPEDDLPFDENGDPLPLARAA